MPHIYRMVGLFGVALLVLSACEQPGDQPGDGPGAEASPEDQGTEGTGDQEEAPGETAGEAPEDSEAPELEEIEDHIWDASTSQESVSITGEVSPALLGWETVTAEQEQEPDNEAESGDGAPSPAALSPVPLSAVGQSEGDGSVYRLGDVLDYRVFGDAVYQTVDSVVAEYELSEPPEGAEAPESHELREAFEAEGSWVSVGQAAREFVETPDGFMAALYDGLLEAADVGSLYEVGAQATAETRNGQDVWVYQMEEEEDFLELVVEAEESEPLLQQISYDLGGLQGDLEFSEWNQAPTPDEPEDEKVIDAEETQVILDSLG